MIKTTFRIMFLKYVLASTPEKVPHLYPAIGRSLLSYRATPTLLEGTIVSLVRVGVAL